MYMVYVCRCMHICHNSVSDCLLTSQAVVPQSGSQPPCLPVCRHVTYHHMFASSSVWLPGDSLHLAHIASGKLLTKRLDQQHDSCVCACPPLLSVSLLCVRAVCVGCAIANWCRLSRTAAVQQPCSKLYDTLRQRASERAIAKNNNRLLVQSVQ